MVNGPRTFGGPRERGTTARRLSGLEVILGEPRPRVVLTPAQRTEVRRRLITGGAIPIGREEVVAPVSVEQKRVEAAGVQAVASEEAAGSLIEKRDVEFDKLEPLRGRIESLDAEISSTRLVGLVVKARQLGRERQKLASEFNATSKKVQSLQTRAFEKLGKASELRVGAGLPERAAPSKELPPIVGPSEVVAEARLRPISERPFGLESRQLELELRARGEERAMARARERVELKEISIVEPIPDFRARLEAESVRIRRQIEENIKAFPKVAASIIIPSKVQEKIIKKAAPGRVVPKAEPFPTAIIAASFLDIGGSASALGFQAFGEVFIPPELELRVPTLAGERRITKPTALGALGVAGELAFFAAGFQFIAPTQVTLAQALRIPKFLVPEVAVRTSTKGKFIIEEVGGRASVVFEGVRKQRVVGKGARQALARAAGFETTVPVRVQITQTEVARIPRLAKEVKNFGLRLKEIKTEEKLVRGLTTVPGAVRRGFAVDAEALGKRVVRLPSVSVGLKPRDAELLKPLLEKRIFVSEVVGEKPLEILQATQLKETRIRAGQIEQQFGKKVLRQFSLKAEAEIRGIVGREEFSARILQDIKGQRVFERGIKDLAQGILRGEIRKGGKVVFLEPSSVLIVSKAAPKIIPKLAAAKRTPLSVSFGGGGTVQQFKALEKFSNDFLNVGAAASAIGASFLKTTQRSLGAIIKPSVPAAVAIARAARPRAARAMIDLAIPGSAVALARGLKQRPRVRGVQDVLLSSSIRFGEISEAAFRGLQIPKLETVSLARVSERLAVSQRDIQRVSERSLMKLADMFAPAQRLSPALATRQLEAIRLGFFPRLPRVTFPDIGKPPAKPSARLGFGLPVGLSLFFRKRARERIALPVDIPGFNTEVKVRGKFRKESVRPLHRNTAGNLGAFLVDNSASQSFRVVKAKKPARGRRDVLAPLAFKFRKPIRKGVPQRKSNVFIERQPFLIDSPGEDKEITRVGLAALRRRFFRPFGFQRRKRRKR